MWLFVLSNIATDLRLGRPLPYKLPDRPQAHPQAQACIQWPALAAAPKSCGLMLY